MLLAQGRPFVKVRLERKRCSLLVQRPQQCQKIGRPGRYRNIIQTQAYSKAALKSEWWTQYSHLWIDVKSEEHFYDLLKNSKKYSFVDFYATWCTGCQKSFPLVTQLATDDEFKQNYQFIKVNADEFRSIYNQQKVRALPYAMVYRPGEVDAIYRFQAVPSRIKVAIPNMRTILANPGKSFMQDPSGFLVAHDRDDAADAAKAAKRDAEIAALTAKRGTLFEKLKHKQFKPSSSGATGVEKRPASIARNRLTGGGAEAVDDGRHAIRLSKEIFMRRHGSQYGYGLNFNAFYQKELGKRLAGQHYLDYTGSSVYCASQMAAVFQDLSTNVYGNPHSANPSSQLSSDKIEEIRSRVLSFFNASGAEYQVVFTKSATDALKTVGEGFPFTERSTFRYLNVNHNSVLGIREYAMAAGGRFEAVNEGFVNKWVGGGAEDGGGGPEKAEGGGAA